MASFSDLVQALAGCQTALQHERIEADLSELNAPDGNVAHGLMLALFQPDIPQNAGTMLRTCACLGVAAAIIEPAGFPTSDRHFRRAGLDYLDQVSIARHASFEAFEGWRRAALVRRRLVLLTTRGAMDYRDVAYRPDDILLVGRESAGVPDTVHQAADVRATIAMKPPARSLNVAIAAAIVLGEALRQIGL